MTPSQLTIPCVLRITSDGEPDEYGDDQSVVTEVHAKCWHELAATSDDAENVARGAHRVWFTPTGTILGSGDNETVDVDLTKGDEVEIDDQVWQVEGDAWRATNPRTQRVEHVEALIVRTT